MKNKEKGAINNIFLLAIIIPMMMSAIYMSMKPSPLANSIYDDAEKASQYVAYDEASWNEQLNDIATYWENEGIE